jgi:UDP-N-acetylmuramoyl-tripeptide--D-alanyl-D-alanine ligase
MATTIPGNQVRFKLSEIATCVAGTLVGEDVEIEGVTIDSRAVTPGALFVAVRGDQHDGAKFVPAACQQGARALLVHAGGGYPSDVARVEVADTTRALGDLGALHRQRWGRAVIAITGSVGKTTTKELAASALAATGLCVHKTQGNLNNQFGVPMTLFGLTSTHDVAVLEVGTNAPGEIARLGAIARPDVAAVLIAAAAHTEGLGSVAQVAAEKASLFAALDASGVCVVNADDPELLPRTPVGPKRVSFGTSAQAQVRLIEARPSVAGTAVTLSVEGLGEQQVQLALIGYAAAINACAAIACVVALKGVDAVPDALRGLGEVKPSPGRMAPRSLARGITIIDDTYNANPRSTQVSLQTLRELASVPGARSIAVLSDMKELGALSHTEHMRIGELAVRSGIDVLVGCGPEMAHATTVAARLSAGRLAPHPTRVAHVHDPVEAARIVRSLWRKGDVVLVKGSRSMMMERVVEALCQGEVETA